MRCTAPLAALALILSACSAGYGDADEESVDKAAKALEAETDAAVNSTITDLQADAAGDIPANGDPAEE